MQIGWLMLQRECFKLRFGIGYDVHKLVKGKSLVLGGIRIDYPLGLEGHSDADVLLHALMDALLGAAALKDIGHCFPDTDQNLKDIDSLILLDKVVKYLTGSGYVVNNIDATIICQKPKLAKHIPLMVNKIAATISLPRTSVNVKATTTEGLGFIGNGQGIAALAIASIKSKEG
jgi:2-C-methyl-D-erythritol 2,4-cyclodiphosphate synthase